jgi:hypothetical protein
VVGIFAGKIKMEKSANIFFRTGQIISPIIDGDLVRSS